MIIIQERELDFCEARDRCLVVKPRLGKCECGLKVELERFTNPCDCGRDYNSTGTLLAHRSQWGEETGETWRDCFDD